MIQFTKISFAFLFLFFFENNSIAQCNNFSNSITVPAQGTINGCNDTQPSATATICADFNVTFSSGNASFFWGYSEIVNNTTTTTTNGPINTSQSAQFPDIICVDVPCGASITFFVTAYSNPNGGGSVCNGANATISTLPFSPLPVVLSEFYAKSLNSAISLQWKTNSEINNDYFEIWKSKNGIDWFYLDQIDGQGNSSEEVLYSYIDQEMPNYNLVLIAHAILGDQEQGRENNQLLQKLIFRVLAVRDLVRRYLWQTRYWRVCRPPHLAGALPHYP